MHFHEFQVPVASSKRIRRLRSLLVTPSIDHSTLDGIIVYLHGFPDMSVHPLFVDFASRTPRKLAERFVTPAHNFGLVAFNFGGVSGSDEELHFEHKTVTQEVDDTIAVCKYVREHLLNDVNTRVHLVGLSTGAIIGSLMRDASRNVYQDKRLVDTISVIAGLYDVEKGLYVDFNDDQTQMAKKEGYCYKEYYLPDNSPLPVGAAFSTNGTTPFVGDVEQLKDTKKFYLKLRKKYLDEFVPTILDIPNAVTSSEPLCPFLVIHGTEDKGVPFEYGQQLFDNASEPKRFAAVQGGNHMLTTTKHMKRALQEIEKHIRLSG